MLVAGIFVFNVFNYLFHFSMARMLGPVDYGVLASLMSILYLFSIPSETIQTTIARYTAIFRVKKEDGKIKYLIRKSIGKCLKLGLIATLIFIAISPLIQGFLKFDSIMPIIALSLVIFPIIISPIVRGALQGIKRFKALGLNFSLEGVIKLILAIALVLIGWNVYGPIIAIIIASFITFFIAFYYLKDIDNKKERNFSSKGVFSYSIPVFVALICLTVMYSIDMILAKHFFSEQDAGIYAVASLLGKMIFFGLSPVAKAMFPVVAERKESKKEYKHILMKALSIVFALCILIVAIYYFFPQLLISLLFGSKYAAASNLIFYLGIGFSFLTLSYILVFYNLSLGKTKSIFSLALFAVIEVILLSIFNSSLLQFCLSFLIINIITFIFLFIFNRDR